LQAALHLTLARSYSSLTLYAATEREARRALELSYALGPAERIEAALSLTRALSALDRWAEASAVAEAWAEDPAFSRARASTRFALRRIGHTVKVRQGAPAEAASGLEALLAESRNDLGPDDPISLGIETRLAEAMIAAGRDGEAEALLRARIAAGGTGSPDTLPALDARFLLTRAVASQGRHAEARVLLEEVVPLIRARYGVDHSRTRVAVAGLAAAYQKTGDTARAAPLFEAVAEAWEEREGPHHSETLTARANHARALAALGDARADELLRGAFEGRERLFGPDNPRTLQGLYLWADQLRRDGRLEEAEPLFLDVIARAERAAPDQDVPLHRYRAHLGLLRLHQGRATEAAELLLLAWEGFAAAAGPLDSETLVVGMNYGTSLGEVGNWSEAVDVLIAILSDMRESLPADDPMLRSALNNLAHAHLQRGESRLALARLLDALEWADENLPSEDPQRLKALDRVGTQLVGLDRPDEALTYFEELSASVDLNPDLDALTRSSFRLGYARCLAACGRLDAAEEEYETVLEMERARLAGADAAAIAQLEDELRAVQRRR
ncbi:MAG: tetratricopeptide repeat protein, partial [Planctomycetota bacterium]